MSSICFQSFSAGTVLVQGAERFRLLSEVARQLAAAGVAQSGGVLPTVADLNACLGLATPVAVLVARLSGQVELIVWVDGPNRAWLAEQLQLGIDAGALRAEAGWLAAVVLLLVSDAEPVFIDCTAGEQFPTAEGWAGTAEAWQALAAPDRWAHGEAVLRGESEREDATGHLAEHPVLLAAPFSRELRPANWQQFFFAAE